MLFCFQEENKCHPNPCRNGGICTEANGAYICTCMEGYKGINCEGIFLFSCLNNNLNDCKSNAYCYYGNGINM